jgi:hypothetical protein
MVGRQTQIVRKGMIVRERLEVLSALRQVVGSKLLSQVWHGLTMLSFSVPCGIDLKQRLGKHRSERVMLLEVVSNRGIKDKCRNC